MKKRRPSRNVGPAKRAARPAPRQKNSGPPRPAKPTLSVPPDAAPNPNLRAAAKAPAALRPKRRPPNKTKGAPAVSRTLILVKPDAFERALTGEVIARFERKGLRI